MRGLLVRLLTLGTLLTAAASAWTLAQHPFAAPLVARETSDARAALGRALALRVTPDWLTAEVEAALADEDLDRLNLALILAETRDITLPRPLMLRALAQAEAADAPLQRIKSCAACAWDTAACSGAAEIAACALPVELTPLGDANALRRGFGAWLGGTEVDRIDVALAAVGLAATGAVVVTAGGSALIKGGATVLRLARRAGTLSPVLAADLTRMASRALPGGETARLAPLASLAGDLGTVSRRTSPGEAVLLLRHVDTAGDASRLARLSGVMGTRTRATIHALGKSRSFRMLNRLTGLALSALALLAALAGQILALVFALLRRLLR